MIINVGDKVRLSNGDVGVVEVNTLGGSFPLQVADRTGGSDWHILCKVDYQGASHGLPDSFSVERILSTKKDTVNQPSHYQTESGLEAIEVLEAFFLENGRLWNCVKYLLRAGKKGDKLEDLRKAEFYLKREIATVSKRSQQES